jgi:cytochrome P450
MPLEKDRRRTLMMQETLLRQIADYAHRANPYPLYAQLRQTPVCRQEDGTYVVSTYREILALLHDPRISSDERNRSEADASPSQSHQAPAALPPSFLMLDPPDHDRLRRLAMRYFGPPHRPGLVDGLRGDLVNQVNGLIDQFQNQSQIDIVDSFAYPLPVTVICHLLGVPPEDEPRFHAWADALVNATGAEIQANAQELQRTRAQAGAQLQHYLAELIEAHRQQPGEDMLSGMATDDGPEGRMSQGELVSTAMLLLLAGHETTVNLIANGVLTLLRHPDILQRLHREPDLIIRTVEELLRYEPPVQFLPQRTALQEVTIAGTTIAKGAPLMLLLASGNRDPERFADPDRFDPDRQDNQHLGLGSGIHNCFGAPLARLETQIALTELVRRLENPRLVADPPPYRPSPVLRGPRHLLVAVDGVRA